MAQTKKKPGAPILIIDDDTGSREALADVLGDEGYEVQTFADAAAALASLRDGRVPRVILLDLMMPGMDGWDFRAEQKRDPRLATVPIISISAAGKLIDADHALRKPIAIERLLELLREIDAAR